MQILQLIRNKDKKFDYSLIDLENFRTGDKVKIICKVHGEFSQSFSGSIILLSQKQPGYERYPNRTRLIQINVPSISHICNC